MYHIVLDLLLMEFFNHFSKVWLSSFKVTRAFIKEFGKEVVRHLDYLACTLSKIWGQFEFLKD